MREVSNGLRPTAAGGVFQPDAAYPSVSDFSCPAASPAFAASRSILPGRNEGIRVAGRVTRAPVRGIRTV